MKYTVQQIWVPRQANLNFHVGCRYNKRKFIDCYTFLMNISKAYGMCVQFVSKVYVIYPELFAIYAE
jgi:hypothetical protein